MMLSVLLPVNRDDGFLDESINSILSQTFTDFELLVIANNCSEGLWSYLMDKSKIDKRINIVRLKLGGLTFALNYGINIAKGKYIARMDADDICMPNRFEKQVDFLEGNPGVDLVGSLVQYIDERGQSLDRTCFLPENHVKILRTLPWKSTIVHPSVMAKHSVFLELGGYKYGFYGEDYEMWLRLSSSGFILHNIQLQLLKYRSHSNQLSNNKFNKIKAVDIKSLLYRNYLVNRSIGFLFGILVQCRIVQYFIEASSTLRNKIKRRVK